MQRTTPITGDNDTDPVHLVPLPDGWVRVWRGTARLGDRFLDSQAFHLYGRVEWVRLTFERLVEAGDVAGMVETFTCLTRERPAGEGDVGAPCTRCKVRVPDPDCTECWKCSLPLPGGPSDGQP